MWNKDEFLDTATELECGIILSAFAARVRSGFYGKGHQIKVPSVAEALSAISKTIQLARKRSPVYREDEKYILPVEKCLEGMRRDDPPAIPQLAVPVTVPIECHRQAYTTKDNGAKAAADLSLIVFFYLLRVGEYTMPHKVMRNGKWKRATRTMQFQVNNVGFYKNGKLLPRTSSLKRLLEADAATLKITNQKNGRMGQTIHLPTIQDEHSPVKAVARRIHHILSNGGSEDDLICMYEDTGKLLPVTPNRMIRQLRSAVKTLNLQAQGIDPDLIGVHSLRAGGAMLLKLHGEEDTTIMKQGRWSSLTFLMYIHEQIAHLSRDITKKMNTPVPFLNIACVN
jgi:hypothetical protein